MFLQLQLPTFWVDRFFHVASVSSVPVAEQALRYGLARSPENNSLARRTTQTRVCKMAFIGVWKPIN